METATLATAPSDTPPVQCSPKRALRFISGLTVTMVVVLAIASFALSFEALWHFAASSGAIAAQRAWVFPFVVDGSIIVFSVSALRCSIAREDGRWPMSLVICATAFSVVFNVAHAPGGFLPGLVGAMPPVLLFLSFESLMRQIKSELRGDAPATRPRKRPGLFPRLVRKAPASTSNRAPGPRSGSEDQEKRKREASRLLADGLSKRAVAKKLGMSLRTIRKLAPVEQAA